jgi:plasmid stability protein
MANGSVEDEALRILLNLSSDDRAYVRLMLGVDSSAEIEEEARRLVAEVRVHSDNRDDQIREISEHVKRLRCH